MKPKITKDGKNFTAEFNVLEQRQFASVAVTVTLCEKLGIDGAAEAVDGLHRVLVACGYLEAEQ